MHSSGRSIAVAGSIALALIATGCPSGTRIPGSPAPTPRISIPPPRIQARAHPAFRLVIPPRSVDAPTRLVAVFVRIRNVDESTLVVRPDLIRLELPDGSARFALDKPRAFEIMRRSLLARYETDHDGGRLSRSEQRQWENRFHEDLLDQTRLSPGESVEGFVIVDTSRRFDSLEDTVVEAIAEPAEPDAGQSERFPVRVLLGAPIEVTP